jgi:hypothetical protein
MTIVATTRGRPVAQAFLKRRSRIDVEATTNLGEQFDREFAA